jgi:Holliday junction resolvasome RuvABC endonuclease subunit
MRVLGIKCSKAELGWIVIEGTTRADATVVACEHPKVPSGERGEQLAWLRKELLEAITTHTPDVAALAMSEGKSAIVDRSQMDGVVLATLYEKQIACTCLFSASIRSKFSVQKIEEVKPLVAALPAYTPKMTAAEKKLLTVAAAIFPN